MVGGLCAIKSAIICPIPVPRLIPLRPPPVAINAPGRLFTGPIIGRRSGEIGLRQAVWRTI